MTEPAPQRRAARNVRAIVVGAASGTGEQFARHLAARDADLLLVDRDELALARLRHEINAHALACDVLDERCVSGIFDAAEQLLGAVDLLINAAGAGYVRTLGVMRASREFARRPRLARALIVNVAAAFDEAGGPFEYAGSKAAFSRLTDGLARAIEHSDLKVITLDSIGHGEAVADLVDQLLRQLPGPGPSATAGNGQAEPG